MTNSCSSTLVQGVESLEQSRRMSLEGARPPRNVPGYEILQPLGEGSYGSVWLARESKTGRQVAIKFYSRRRGLDWPLLSREVEKLAALYTSRNVVGLLDVGWDHEPPFFVMEYLERGSLETRLQAGRMPVEDAVRVTRSVARALVHAHGHGILHCDVKPANVLLDAESEPRLGDFGQSRLTTEQSPAPGTVFYMAPEQAVLDNTPDPRWDVYALGAVLFHMLTGHPPYRTPEAIERLNSASTLPERLELYRQIVFEGDPPDETLEKLGIDRRLRDIVSGCLTLDPSERIPTPQAVLDLLDRREQARARRPLVLLGFLGPILFLLAMYWIAEAAIPDIVSAAETNLVERALGSDVVAARILATSVAQELRARQDHLEQIATDPHVLQVLDSSRGLTSAELFTLSNEGHLSGEPNAAYVWMRNTVNEAEAQLIAEHRTRDDSWFLTDAQGKQVFRYPSREPGRKTTLGRPFHWRDYFHAQGAEFDPAIPLDSVTPRQSAGLSLPFRSQATDRYMVAIAVPVRGSPDGPVLGILARTLHLT